MPSSNSVDQAPLTSNSNHMHVSSHHSIGISSSNSCIHHHKCLQPCTFSCEIDMCKINSQPSSSPEARQFSGDFSGMTWNPRALFARNGIRMARRSAKVRRLGSDMDLCCITRDSFFACSCSSGSIRISEPCIFLVPLLAATWWPLPSCVIQIFVRFFSLRMEGSPTRTCGEA